MSNIAAIITILNMVPRPGFCFKKNHENKTTTLTIKVTIPMDNPELIEIPCAITVHGELPINEITTKASPKPNNIRPKQRKNKVDNFGFKLKVL
jgi:hypothetical protein